MKSIIRIKSKKNFTLIIFLLAFNFSFSQVIDSSFGINGMQTLNVDNDFVHVNAMQFQDKKILLSVFDEDEFYYYPGVDIFRLTRNGGFDSSFSSVGGISIRTLVGGNFCIQPDNKILVGGRISDRSGVDPNGTVAIYRFLYNGKADKSFGKNGRFSMVFTPFNSIETIAVKNDGKIIAAGPLKKNPGKAISFFQLSQNGVIDSTFGKNGFIYQTSPYENACSDLRILDNGKILALFSYDSSKYTKTCLIRYRPSGRIDSTFGINGIAINDTAASKSGGASFTIASDNKILVFAKDSISAGIILRYKPNGTLDKTFGDHGEVPVATHYHNPIFCIATDSANRILINEGTPYETIARYKENGTPDSSFGVNGQIPSTSVSSLILVEPNGKLLVFGMPGLINPVIERYKFDHSSAIPSKAEQAEKNVTLKESIITIYPNPVKDILHIVAVNNTADYDLTITNAQGILVATKHISGTYNFNVQQLSSGVYHLSIISNNKIFTQSFIKQ